MSLYNLKSADGDQFRITKFDSDLNVESSYLVSNDACECPQFVNRDKRCRHQRMLKQFLKGPTIRLDTNWYYDYDHDAWYSPTLDSEPTQPEAHDGPTELPASATAKSDQPSAPKPEAPFVRRI